MTNARARKLQAAYNEWTCPDLGGEDGRPLATTEDGHTYQILCSDGYEVEGIRACVTVFLTKEEAWSAYKAHFDRLSEGKRMIWRIRPEMHCHTLDGNPAYRVYSRVAFV